MTVYSCIDGKNNVLVKDIESLYFRPGMRIADLTYGKGNFWTKVDLSQYEFYPSDIDPSLGVPSVDLRNTNFLDNIFDVVVLDPPYAQPQGGRRKKLNKSFGLEHIKTIHDIQELYFKGIIEARRILAKDGLLLIKCQDVTYGGKDYWMHVDIMNFSQDLGLKAIDLFVLKNSINVPGYEQKGSRRNHSYMWVFKNTTGKRRIECVR